MCACVTTSSPVVGSSSTSSRGRHDERHRDHHPLLLPARELVRVAVQELRRRRQVHPPQRLRDALVARLVRAVRAQHVADRVADPQRGVEARARLLRHVRDEAAPQRPRRALVAERHRLPVDLDLARRDAAAPAARSRAARAPSSSCRDPDSPTSASVSPCATAKAMSSTTGTPERSSMRSPSTRIAITSDTALKPSPRRRRPRCPASARRRRR